eukprot:scaffold4203_cov295-Prasinococcus_capsulatus_cf.AAC.3
MDPGDCAALRACFAGLWTLEEGDVVQQVAWPIDVAAPRCCRCCCVRRRRRRRSGCLTVGCWANRPSRRRRTSCSSRSARAAGTTCTARSCGTRCSACRAAACRTAPRTYSCSASSHRPTYASSARWLARVTARATLTHCAPRGAAVQPAVLVRNGEWSVEETLSELGVYSIFLSDGTSAANDDSNSGVLVNEAHGHLLRTKSATSDEGGVAAGFARLRPRVERPLCCCTVVPRPLSRRARCTAQCVRSGLPARWGFIIPSGQVCSERKNSRYTWVALSRGGAARWAAAPRLAHIYTSKQPPVLFRRARRSRAPLGRHRARRRRLPEQEGERRRLVSGWERSPLELELQRLVEVGLRLVDVVAQDRVARGLLELADGLVLDLPDALPRHLEVFPYLLQRLHAPIVQPEAQPHHVALARAQCVQHVVERTRRGGRSEAGAAGNWASGHVRRLGARRWYQVCQVALAALAALVRARVERRVDGHEAYRAKTDKAGVLDVSQLGELHAELLGDLVVRGPAAQLLLELSAAADDACVGLEEVDGEADDARLVGDGASDRLADPPVRVGGELVALARVELLRAAHESLRALLHEVLEGHAAVEVLLGHRHHEAHVRRDHLVLRLDAHLELVRQLHDAHVRVLRPLAPRDLAPQLLLHVLLEPLELQQALHVPAQLPLLLHRQQLRLRDLFEVGRQVHALQPLAVLHRVPRLAHLHLAPLGCVAALDRRQVRVHVDFLVRVRVRRPRLCGASAAAAAAAAAAGERAAVLLLVFRATGGERGAAAHAAPRERRRAARAAALVALDGAVQRRRRALAAGLLLLLRLGRHCGCALLRTRSAPAAPSAAAAAASARALAAARARGVVGARGDDHHLRGGVGKLVAGRELRVELVLRGEHHVRA